MPINDQQDREVTFISGVDADGKVAGISFYTLTYKPDDSLVVPPAWPGVGSPHLVGSPIDLYCGGTTSESSGL